MSYTDLNSLPGVCKVDSAYSNSIKAAYASTGAAYGRFTDMLNSRFIAGRPEKLGGYALNTIQQLTGVCRGEKDWRDYNQNLYCAFGTHEKLQVLSNGILIDITPFRAIITSTLTNPLTTNATTTVEVTHTAHGLSTGDYVQLTAANVVDNVQVAGTYFITKVDANNYDITVPAAATGSSSSAGGVVSYVYYRVTISNPLTTVSGSNIVTVAQTNHGAQVGDFVTISNATAVNGITLSGEYVIQSTTTDTYTVIGPNVASGSGTGGGTPNFQYDISIGNINSGALMGYGLGGYSQGGYSQSTSSNFITPARTWCLDNYGQQLLASPYAGTIYVWDPSTYASNNGRAYPLYGAPATVLAMFITPERFVMALGTTGNYLVVQWPDQSDYTNWVPSTTNTADIRTLQIGSYIVGGVAARDGTSLVLTNNCCYAFNYSGDQYIYDSTSVGRNSGLIGPLAIGALGGAAYWMGPNEFWTWNGGIQPLPSDDIRDYVYGNINKQQLAKCFAVTTTAKKEVTFYYCSAGSIEIDRNVTFHIDQGCWSINIKSRTSQVDALIFPYPISADFNGNIWNEEFGNDANGAAMDAYVTFNPTDIMKGGKNIDLTGFKPDFERQSGDLLLTVLTSTYPDDPPVVNGPFTLSANDAVPLLDLRIGTKMVGYQVESNTIGGDYRLGLCQADVSPAGDRR